MVMTKHQLSKTLEELSEYRGRNTELVSLYIPPDYDIRKIIGFLNSEQSEAQNIKSKNTRKNVISALEKMERRLKNAGEIPDNGIALFSGNVSEQEGRPDIQMWEVEPPEPIESRIYRCDKEFQLEDLEDLLIDKEVYGMICLDKSEAAIGYVRGNHLTVEYTLDSEVPGKTTKGGQSQQRFERIRENLFDTFLNQIAEKAKKAFLEKARNDELLGLIVGGPGFAKEDLTEKEYLPKELLEKLLTTIGTNYSGEQGLKELLNKSEDIIEKSEAVREKKKVNSFLVNLKKENGKSVFGLEDVAKALKMGAVETLLISEEFEQKEAKFECTSCGNREVKHISDFEAENERHECEECGSKMELVEKKDVVEMFQKKAGQMDSTVMFISRQHEEGERLWKMGGIAAILRYRIQ